MKKIVIVTGGYDPLHSGHIAYFKEARRLGDELVVGLNSDEWLSRKKGRPFMTFNERAAIIQELSCVDSIIGFNDSDDSACGAIMQILSTNGNNTKVVFANGGDRTNINTPEYNMYGDFNDVEFVFGVGGEDKKNSSSWILKEWQKPNVSRHWGNYTILDSQELWQVKELSIDIGKSLSNQRHFIRSEHWCIVSGLVRLDLVYPNGDKLSKTYGPGESIDIPVCTWHRATNVGNHSAKVIEVWMGAELHEDDIERKEDE